MARKDASKEALDTLRAMAQAGPADDSASQLAALLGHRSNHVVGRAAKLAGDWQLKAVIPELLAAFERFMKSPVKSDPTCAAKRPIMEALISLGHGEPDIYLRGMRHVQMEPVYGGSEDTAATLRGISGEGLLGCRYTDVFLEMASLLMDLDPRTRRIATESLGQTEALPAELLLRTVALADRLETARTVVKRLQPDEEDGDIIALALQGLMRIAPERSLTFVADFLHADKSTVSEGAALAIGEARLPESFSILRQAGQGVRGLDLSMLVLPMALTRDDAALSFLLQVVEDEPTPYAVAAVNALGIYSGDGIWRTRIAEAVAARGGRQVTAAFEAVFET